MTEISPPPTILSVLPANIPDLLKREKRWVGWWPRPKPTGKFDKVPVDPWTGEAVNPIDPANWLTFDGAMDAYRRNMAKGIGFALSDQHPIMVNGKPSYVVAVDLDQCARRIDEHKAQWRALGQPFGELSPSGKGLHFFGLCDTPLRGGNAGDGRELYSSGRFMTVTGVGARGVIRDISPGLIALEQQWWPGRATSLSAAFPTQPIGPALPETPENVSTVLSMLNHVSSDTDYETWRNIIWAIASTAWASARRIAQIWSAKAPHRYDAAAVDSLLGSFKPGSISLGTLVHHARQNGWTGHLMQSMTAQPPLIPPPPPVPTSSALLTIAQLRQLPQTPYVVRGLLPSRGLAAIYGEPGSGKSFLAIDLAHAIAMARADWFGFAVEQAPVAYVALEGQSGIAKRFTATEMHTNQPCSDQVRFWCRDIQLLKGDGVDLLASEIVKALGTGAVVIIDTLNQASPGADENSSQDMGKIIAAAKRLAAAVGGLVVFVHHAGKNRALGLRGHSSLNAAMDAVIEVVKEATGRKWRVTKAKDDSGDVARDFDLVSYTVGQDAFGAITSCAVQQTVRVSSPVKKPIAGKHQAAALAALRSLLSAPGQSIAYKDAIDLVVSALAPGTGKARDRAKDAVDSLLRGGHLLTTNGGICLA